MIDIVIDTCTLVHASNPESQYFEHSVEFIQKMLSNTILIIVDEGFDLDSARNKSYIGLEYITHLAAGMLGSSLIQLAAQTGRIKFVSNKVNYNDKKFIEKTVKNKKDRMFLRVAINSDEQILISHDYTDYDASKRPIIESGIGVKILDASEINPLL